MSVGDRAHGGRTRITSRALDRVVGAVSAEALGVEARTVSVDLSDDNGQLVVQITAPIPVRGPPRVGALVCTTR
ncbi:MAG: hypothetical protein H7248_09150 [Microbacteriaceae bacterium]|nr:hypothetical protein [Microbacteriaceae bacterium]